MTAPSKLRARCDDFVGRHPVVVIALLALATFAMCLVLLYQTAPRVVYEFF
jgi:hypothetical protein